eukprot:scaffold1220_cov259-Pinguiococcus_pyrenoidosus.AAC.87
MISTCWAAHLRTLGAPKGDFKAEIPLSPARPALERVWGRGEIGIAGAVRFSRPNRAVQGSAAACRATPCVLGAPICRVVMEVVG